ncbi:hypothetical protein CXP43_07065 [Bacillus velezensis]|nr:hypothetical protein OY17_10025 [Bacillus sp. BH072]AUG35497.1 hypothetical protein CXP43_07065 [Bacillus velezensis]KFI16315.1 hypothetical protein IO97_07015 [Bacillus velezensis]
MPSAHKKASSHIHLTMAAQKAKKFFERCMTFRKKLQTIRKHGFPVYFFLKIQRENAIPVYFMV